MNEMDNGLDGSDFICERTSEGGPVTVSCCIPVGYARYALCTIANRLAGTRAYIQQMELHTLGSGKGE